MKFPTLVIGIWFFELRALLSKRLRSRSRDGPDRQLRDGNANGPDSEIDRAEPLATRLVAQGAEMVEDPQNLFNATQQSEFVQVLPLFTLFWCEIL